jgi:hypothetical protein
VVARFVVDFMIPGEAGEQHSHDASEENTVESPGFANRGGWRAEPADGVEV